MYAGEWLKLATISADSSRAYLKWGSIGLGGSSLSATLPSSVYFSSELAGRFSPILLY